MDQDTIFLRIIRREIPAQIEYEDEDVIAIKDINPQAPVHILIIPKKRIRTLNDVAEEDIPLLGKMTYVAVQIAMEKGIAETGYRLVWNCNRDAGQSVFHIHLHLLGGRILSWPPG